jgi:hypothetical protein
VSGEGFNRKDAKSAEENLQRNYLRSFLRGISLRSPRSKQKI